MARRYWTGSHTKHRLRFHLVWIPKRRKKVLLGNIANRLQELFYEACGINKWWIEELTIQEDHIHLLIQIKPRESVAQVVQILKGGTSRKIKQEYPDSQAFEWSNNLWCDGYFAESVGQVNEQVIKDYIKNQ
ncbi:MAG: IS200/IS605 family transposase [Pseudomonadales bacterium]|nr:IS200/IS605 family transposase [Candidatus Woesebacteria bacterium]MCB9801569.1 IS200/IS605 family transposase [Pseudomonadales bacterium]